jgi:DNA mismatch repair protein MutS2
LDNKAIIILEFNKIINTLKSFAVTYIGKQLTQELEPSSNIDDILHMQKETSEATSYYLRQHDIPLSPISDIGNVLSKLNIGGILSIDELIKVTDILRVSRKIKNSFSNGTIESEDFPIFSEYFNELYQNKNVEDEISRCIKNEEELEDRASQELYKIRKDIKDSESRIKEKLSSILHTKSKYLQEEIITFRDGRYVLPVKAEYKNEVPGLIHDQSSTGSTIFIEPTSIFNLNNDIKELQLKEQLEVQRILSLLSQMLMPITYNISNTIRMIGKIDFALAKGKYAISIDAIMPEFNSTSTNMKSARHPLIDPDKVVPIDIWFGDTFNCLIITGPNTGGKTVTLKTVGLLTIMAQSGLFIPVKSGTSLRIFEIFRQVF